MSDKDKKAARSIMNLVAKSIQDSLNRSMERASSEGERVGIQDGYSDVFHDTHEEIKADRKSLPFPQFAAKWLAVAANSYEGVN